MGSSQPGIYPIVYALYKVMSASNRPRHVLQAVACIYEEILTLLLNSLNRPEWPTWPSSRELTRNYGAFSVLFAQNDACFKGSSSRAPPMLHPNLSSTYYLLLSRTVQRSKCMTFPATLLISCKPYGRKRCPNEIQGECSSANTLENNAEMVYCASALSLIMQAVLQLLV